MSCDYSASVGIVHCLHVTFLPLSYRLLRFGACEL